MKLITASKHEIECSDTSTIENVVVIANSFTEVEEISKKLNEKELKRVLLNDVEYLNVQNISISATKQNEKVIVSITNQKEDDLAYIKRTLKDTAKALAEQSELVASLMTEGEN